MGKASARRNQPAAKAERKKARQLLKIAPSRLSLYAAYLIVLFRLLMLATQGVDIALLA